jgi:dephospho-CoA kinase
MEGNTQLTLHNESIDEIVNLLKAIGPPEVDSEQRQRYRTYANTIEAQRKPRPDAIALCGLPGAGKSYAAEELAKVYDTSIVTMGDAIREKFFLEHDREYEDGEELGEFAAEWRAEDPEGIPEFVIKMSQRQDGQPIIIDGVRSCTDYEVLEDYFDDFYLIEVEAEFYKRLSRLQKRGREGEAKFTAVDLAERDERERRDLGFGELQDTVYIDMNIKNGTGADQLAISLSSIVESNLPFEIQNGKPLGLDDKLEKVRKELK